MIAYTVAIMICMTLMFVEEYEWPAFVIVPGGNYIRFQLSKFGEYIEKTTDPSHNTYPFSSMDKLINCTSVHGQFQILGVALQDVRNARLSWTCIDNNYANTLINVRIIQIITFAFTIMYYIVMIASNLVTDFENTDASFAGARAYCIIIAELIQLVSITYTTSALIKYRKFINNTGGYRAYEWYSDATLGVVICISITIKILFIAIGLICKSCWSDTPTTQYPVTMGEIVADVECNAIQGIVSTEHEVSR